MSHQGNFSVNKTSIPFSAIGVDHAIAPEISSDGFTIQLTLTFSEIYPGSIVDSEILKKCRKYL